MGGTDDPSNLVKLTIAEHAEAHKKLFEEYGSKFDYIAYLGLSNQIGKEEANYLKMLGPKNWTESGMKSLRENAKKRKGDKRVKPKNENKKSRTLIIKYNFLVRSNDSFTYIFYLLDG